jgi:hypothetical protein
MQRIAPAMPRAIKKGMWSPSAVSANYPDNEFDGSDLTKALPSDPLSWAIGRSWSLQPYPLGPITCPPSLHREPVCSLFFYLPIFMTPLTTTGSGFAPSR